MKEDWRLVFVVGEESVILKGVGPITLFEFAFFVAEFGHDIIDELFGAAQGEIALNLEDKRDILVDALVACISDWDLGGFVILWIEREVELEGLACDSDLDVGDLMEAEGIARIGDAALDTIREDIGLQDVVVLLHVFVRGEQASWEWDALRGWSLGFFFLCDCFDWSRLWLWCLNDDSDRWSWCRGWFSRGFFNDCWGRFFFDEILEFFADDVADIFGRESCRCWFCWLFFGFFSGDGVDDDLANFFGGQRTGTGGFGFFASGFGFLTGGFGFFACFFRFVISGGLLSGGFFFGGLAIGFFFGGLAGSFFFKLASHLFGTLAACFFDFLTVSFF